jgi:2-deoxy-D-gluconate 3-dehydrogenase
MFDLTGKVALVTGGNSGIGLGIAHGLVECGASVAIAGRDEGKIEAALSELNAQRDGSSIGLRCDVTDPDQVTSLVDQVAGKLGTIDILVANAGMGIRRRPEEYSLDEWHRLIDTNLTSVFLCCQAVYPIMKDAGGGKIVITGSMATLFGHPFAAIYAATKGGVVQFGRSLAIAWAAENIQVNSVLPGWIDTPMTVAARGYMGELHQRVLNRTPAGRWGLPSDMAGAACFLASPASDFVTGSAIPVDGGFSIHMP